MAKKYVCKSFNANKNYDAYLKLQTITTELSEIILKRKKDYYHLLSDKLNDPHTSAKSYWSILKTLYNGKEIPLPPILINNKLISNFKEKANHFNAFFASQCTPVSNNSTLPLVRTHVTNASLSSISLNDQNILKTIHSLNINKAHGYDDISIRLLKICDSSIVRLLSIISRTVCRAGIFLITGKSQILYLFIKKVTSNFYKTIDLFLYFQYVVIFLRELFSTQSLNISKKIVFSFQINLAFVHLTHVKTSYYQLFMTFMLILINIKLLK